MKLILDHEEFRQQLLSQQLDEGVWDRIKDHFRRHKHKYLLGAAAATGIGLFAAPMGILAGHLADKHPN